MAQPVKLQTLKSVQPVCSAIGRSLKTLHSGSSLLKASIAIIHRRAIARGGQQIKLSNNKSIIRLGCGIKVLQLSTLGNLTNAYSLGISWCIHPSFFSFLFFSPLSKLPSSNLMKQMNLQIHILQIRWSRRKILTKEF